MLPIIANQDFEKQGVIDDYTSFIWTTRYYSCGDFEICVGINSKSLQLLQYGYYVMRADDENVGIIEHIGISRDEDNNAQMVASGRFVSCVLARRIVAVQTQLSGTVTNCVKKLINENAISPTITARRIPNLSFGTFTNATVSMEQQITGDNLLEAIEGICEANGCGFKTVLDANNNFVFSLYDGVDRSRNQSANTWVIFSQEYDNLESSDYEEDYSNIVTDVLVAGEGEGLDRKTVWASKQTNSGLNRNEIYQDARNASTNNGAISDSTYLKQLKAEGLESVSSYEQAFAGEVYFGNIEYKTDVNVGDICIIENAQWGIAANARLVEVIESTSEDGSYSIMPTFRIGDTALQGVDTSAYIMSESYQTLLSESGSALILEQGEHDIDDSPYSTAARISELDEIASPASTDWLPIASGGTTYKIAYGNLAGGTSDYNDLANKPSIESVTLDGNKTYEELNLSRISNTEIENMLS